MKKTFLIAAMAILTATASAQTATPAYEIVAGDTTCQIFLYSPGERDGLHVAYLEDTEQWRDAGRLCGSDYAQWGAEKRMRDPYVAHAHDGSWRLVFGVNDHSPCFAAAYSEDLLTWRPQDYPRMREKPVTQPILFQMDDGTFDLYFKTTGGAKRYVRADEQFRHFEEDTIPSTIDDMAWTRDTATVAGRRYEGNLFDVPKLHLDYILQYFQAMRHEAEQAKETLRDDARLGDLGHPHASLDIAPDQQKPISDKLTGVFFEDISHAADGGLYAELVQNRDFEYSPDDHKGWSATTAWHADRPITIQTAQPLSPNNPHYAVLKQGDVLYNDGWDGIHASPLASFDFSVWLRLDAGGKSQMQVALVNDDGEPVAKAKIKVEGNGWRRYALPLVVNKKARAGHMRLALSQQKEGTVSVDMVSLFPSETYKGHGLRKDLAEAIAALKPKFVRFPGGCMSHGQGLDNIYHWQESVGPWQDRKPAKNIWGYHQTRGLGFYEYFQFCEDIGAEPLPVLAAGVPCQNSEADSTGHGGQQGGIPMTEMPAYCQEILNLIDWANGDPATSKWAKMRAGAGHPAPFHLKLLAIGNEDAISTAFEERFEMIAHAVKAKYPDITLCGTAGPTHEPSPDYAEGWRFARAHADLIDLVDEHYYESPGWFLHHQDYYDSYDRKGPKVYLGEWASQGRTVENALVEALHLCALERNGDVVRMASYAPLLCHVKHSDWNPNLIYFDHDTITSLTPSYETQKLWANHGGDRYITSRLTLADSLAHRVGASVVKDSRSGRTTVKLVNALPAQLTVSLNGLTVSDGTPAEGFRGQPTDQAVTPLRVTVEGQNVTLPAYSVVAIGL